VAADVALLAARGWLADGALVVVERSARSAEIDWPAAFLPGAARRYGETRLELAEYAPGAD